ncbi:MAG: tetraacyldisaccharide 4'-kinase [Sphingobacteriia bacterium]|nr:tetraacyldisaccharide 4'-kinase [Sphingobacteriia bacterium]
MNFNNLFLKSFRVVLLPLSLIYGLIIIIRNRLFDRNILKSATFNFPVICIGNLAVGGTGKSPMVEYLVQLLHPQFKIATLSRGYKRKTKGYALASEQTTALEIGDEPMQFHLKFPDVAVAVGEERLVAIPYLIEDVKGLQAIILDDAFQHRAVKAGLNILLSDYNNQYIHDFFLPTGELRDEWASARRADIIVITKCPPDLSADKKQKIIKSLRLQKKQKAFFTTIQYGKPYHIIHQQNTITLSHEQEVLLVSGIANPVPLKNYIVEHTATYYEKSYGDHHIFSIDDLNEIKQKFYEMDASHKAIITTEKDAVRLHKFREELKDIPFYVLPIQHLFLFDEAAQFDSIVTDFIRHFTLNQD